MPARPPRENLYRFACRGATLADAPAAAGETPMIGRMTGHFSVFNEWTEINSAFEGTFLERIAPGAFKKTIRDNGPKGSNAMRVLFQHGRDPQIGDKPLGPIDELREDEVGPYYDVGLLDTSYNRDLEPALREGLYGASFRFRVVREDWIEEPDPSAYNPKGLPERTIRETGVSEFGPVTFPAYTGASAELAFSGMRSLTDVIRDVDAVAHAAAVLLDEERLGRAQVFVSRSLPDLAELAERQDSEERDAEPELDDDGVDRHVDPEDVRLADGSLPGTMNDVKRPHADPEDRASGETSESDGTLPAQEDAPSQPDADPSDGTTSSRSAAEVKETHDEAEPDSARWWETPRDEEETIPGWARSTSM